MKPKQMAWMLVVCLALTGIFAGSAMAMEAQKININTASVDELTQLNRVGDKIAERIVAHRDTYGPFEKSEDLMQVKGIGERVFELNKDRIIVAEEDQG